MSAYTAYLIDPFSKTVSEASIPAANSLPAIYHLLGCDCIDAARLEDGHAVYVDDEGLFREDQRFFLIDGYPQPLAGKGLFVGPVDQDGDTTDARRAPHVQFLGDRDDARIWLMLEGL